MAEKILVHRDGNNQESEHQLQLYRTTVQFDGLLGCMDCLGNHGPFLEGQEELVPELL